MKRFIRLSCLSIVSLCACGNSQAEVPLYLFREEISKHQLGNHSQAVLHTKTTSTYGVVEETFELSIEEHGLQTIDDSLFYLNLIIPVKNDDSPEGGCNELVENFSTPIELYSINQYFDVAPNWYFTAIHNYYIHPLAANYVAFVGASYDGEHYSKEICMMNCVYRDDLYLDSFKADYTRTVDEVYIEQLSVVGQIQYFD